MTDGGAVALPLPAEEAQPVPQADGPLRNVDDSLDFIGVRELHDQGVRGQNIVSVVLDTGACSDAIRPDRQLQGADLTPDTDDPWSLLVDHGGMATGIMAGDDSTPGIAEGALPESLVYPIKSTLAASELIQAQDLIVRLAEQNPDKFVIVNNSWGFPECTGLCEHPITQAIANAANHPRVIQVFAAGNNASGATGCGFQCDGSTPGVNGPNSLSNVITVGASGRNGHPTRLQEYSARGSPTTVACGNRKPDVTAPCFGQMPYGCSGRDMGNGGGTSASCPMVAGGIGLLADQQASLSVDGARRGLTRTAQQFQDDSFNGCTGAGNVQLTEAVGATGGVGGMQFDRATMGVVGAGVAGGLLAALLRDRLRRAS